MNKFHYVGWVLLVLLLTLNSKPYIVEALSSEDLKDGFRIDPYNSLFNINNFKPGDSIEKKLTVSNKTESNLVYTFNSHYSKGSKELFDELNTIIKLNEQLIYQGKLKDFSHSVNKKIQSKSNQTISVWIEIPYELGNEFQGTATEFDMKFFVELNGAIIPVEGQLPNTSTSMFNLMAIGVALIIGGFVLISFLKKKHQDIEAT